MRKIKIKIHTKDKKRLTIKKDLIQEENKFLFDLNSKELFDIHNIGRIMLEIEKHMFCFLENNKKKIRKEPLDILTIEFPLLTDLNEKRKDSLANALENFFLFIYNKTIKFDFYNVDYNLPETKDSNSKKYDSILLFSGGLDSMIGTSYCEKKFDKTLLIYTDQKPRLRPIIDKMMSDSLNNFDLIKIRGHQMYSGFFANTAGLSYILNGSIFAYLSKVPLLISECGVTSYQPRFAPLNDITYTTHPHTINTAKEIINIFLNFELDIELPFNDTTKAEMVAKYGNLKKIELSHSCVTTNPFSMGQIIKNCGDCYACFIRKLAILASVKDPTEYKSNINWDKKSNIYPILDFCYMILKDFSLLDYPQREKIIKYNKNDLFERFSLDTFSALYKLSKTESLPQNILDYLSKFESKIFEDRLKELNLMKSEQ